MVGGQDSWTGCAEAQARRERVVAPLFHPSLLLILAVVVVDCAAAGFASSTTATSTPTNARLYLRLRQRITCGARKRECWSCAAGRGTKRRTGSGGPKEAGGTARSARWCQGGGAGGRPRFVRRDKKGLRAASSGHPRSGQMGVSDGVCGGRVAQKRRPAQRPWTRGASCFVVVCAALVSTGEDGWAPRARDRHVSLLGGQCFGTNTAISVGHASSHVMRRRGKWAG